MHVNRRGPYLESFAIFTKLKTSMQAAWDPERGGSVAPCHASSSGSLGSPMAGPGPQRAPGLGWRRRRVAATTRESPHLEAAATTPLRPQAACASPGRTIDGRRCREKSMERGPDRVRGAGVGNAARGPPGAPGEGAAPAPRPAGPGSPACRGAQTEPGGGGRARHTRAHPSRHCSCLPASFPEPSPFSSPHPQPAGGGGGGGALLSPLPLPPDPKDLTVSDTPGGRERCPLPPQT